MAGTAAEGLIEQRKRAALEALSAGHQQAYVSLSAGLDALEARLPAECTDETRGRIGDTISRCKAVAGFANDLFREITEPLNERIKNQRDLWRPLADRATAIQKRAQALVEQLLDAERRRRDEAEAAARKLVAEKMAAQAEAEAKAISAESEQEAAEAKRQADQAWRETRSAVQSLDAAPAQTAVKVGDVTVYEASRLDFEILDMGAFAKAHPELVEVRRGPTLAALREALAGSVSLPEAVPGFPGIRVRLKTTTSSRR